MIIEKVHNKVRYTLSNDNLDVGDKVFPILRGRCLDDGNFIYHDFNYSEACSGFPYDPHTILDLHYSDSKPYEVRTDMGYSNRESYFKIIKKEVQIERKISTLFKSYMWVTLDENDNYKKAKRLISVCDQGHYGSTICSECGEDVSDHFDRCPKCESYLVETVRD